MQTTINSIIIILGAIIMFFSIIKSGETFKMIHLVPDNSRRYVKAVLNIHRTLMVFFLVGYIVVIVSFLMNYEIIGQYFVSIIFLLGSSFVLMGILIQLKLLSEVQSTIHGILPICTSCKKIRLENSNARDQKSWVAIESYFKKKSNTDFSHGICPDCFEKFYSEEIEEQE